MNATPTQDLSLMNDESLTPGAGVAGKMLGAAENGWGGLPQNGSQNHSPTLDTVPESLHSDASISAPHTIATPLPEVPREVTAKDEAQGTEKKLEFYESPTRELLTFEDRALVDPKTLARQLLSRVDYKPEYGASMLEFFLAKERYRVSLDTHYFKNGEMYEKERHIPNSPPMFSEFGRTIGVSERTLKSWAKKYPEFQEAYEICQDIITEFFVENGVKGDYASQFAIFAAKNLTKMKDVLVNKNENYDMKSILDAIEKGQSTDGL